MKTNHAASALFFALSLALPLSAQGGAPKQAKATITKLALFKNGYGFITLTVDNKDNKNMIRLADLPVPSYGTFWAKTDGKTEIKLITGKKGKVDEPSGDFSMLELAQANPGADIRLTTTKGSIIAGKVVNLPRKKDSAAPAPTPRPYYGFPKIPNPAARQEFLIVKTDKGACTIAGDEIAFIDFPNLADLKLPVTQKDSPELEIQLGKVDPSDPVRITCITEGITWVPSYRFELGDDGRGQFSAQADIINELADIDNVDMELITGFPSIKYPRTPSPISMKMSLNEFFASLDNKPVYYGGIRSNVMAQQAYYADGFDGGAGTSALPMQPNDTIRAEDLFFYPVNKVSCPKGETLCVPLFSGSLPYENIMTWDIPNNQERRNRRSPDEADTSKDVWHCVRITNGFDTPLTTAPVEFTSKGRFIGQGQTTFVPVGKKGIIRINKAMDVITSDKENVIAHSNVNFSGRNRAKATTEGTLTVTNASGKPITIRITKDLIGFIESCSDGGEFSQTQALYNNVNPLGTIKWELTIAPNETKDIKYTYYYLED